MEEFDFWFLSQTEFKKYKFRAAQYTKIVGAELGNDAGMYGAAYMVTNA